MREHRATNDKREEEEKYFVNVFFGVRHALLGVHTTAVWAAAPTGDKVLQNGEKFRTSVHPSIYPSIRPSVPPSLLTGPQAPQASPHSSRAGSQTPLAGPQSPVDGRMDGCTDVRNFSPFCRTSSPVGAAALLPSETSQHQRSRAREPLTS